MSIDQAFGWEGSKYLWSAVRLGGLPTKTWNDYMRRQSLSLPTQSIFRTLDQITLLHIYMPLFLSLSLSYTYLHMHNTHPLPVAYAKASLMSLGCIPCDHLFQSHSLSLPSERTVGARICKLGMATHRHNPHGLCNLTSPSSHSPPLATASPWCAAGGVLGASTMVSPDAHENSVSEGGSIG